MKQAMLAQRDRELSQLRRNARISLCRQSVPAATPVVKDLPNLIALYFAQEIFFPDLESFLRASLNQAQAESTLFSGLFSCLGRQQVDCALWNLLLQLLGKFGQGNQSDSQRYISLCSKLYQTKNDTLWVGFNQLIIQLHPQACAQVLTLLIKWYRETNRVDPPLIALFCFAAVLAAQGQYLIFAESVLALAENLNQPQSNLLLRGVLTFLQQCSEQSLQGLRKVDLALHLSGLFLLSPDEGTLNLVQLVLERLEEAEPPF